MKFTRRDVVLCGALGLLLFALAVPDYLSSGPRSIRVSLEWFVLIALAAALPSRRWVAWTLSVLTVGWVFWVTYHRVIERIYLRQPGFFEDWRLVLNLFHFVTEASSWTIPATALGALAAFAALGSITFFAIKELGNVEEPRRLLAFSMMGAAIAANGVIASFPSIGWSRTPLVAFGGLAIADNIRNAIFQAEKAKEWATGPVDTRYEKLLQRRLQHRPNVYLMMIEAYGEVLFTPPFQDYSRTLFEQVKERLPQGYQARTAFSTAPVHGGASWLSIATIQVGLLIDSPSRYAAVERSSVRLPGLTRFFEANGYRTYGLFPGNSDKTGLRQYDQFGRDVVTEGPDLQFHGHIQPFGAAPDQFAWSFFIERHLSKAPSPRFVTSMSVSTHWDWWYQAPYVVDWKTLGDGKEGNEVLAGGWESPPLPTGVGEYGPRYAQAVHYEWRVLLDVIASDPSEDAVFLIVGDHQPYLGPKTDKTSYRTPVHVITRHQATLDAFARAGFSEGLFLPAPSSTPLTHEGLFSLLVSRLAMADGQPDAEAEFFPAGIGLSGLRAVAPSVQPSRQ